MHLNSNPQRTCDMLSVVEDEVKKPLHVRNRPSMIGLACHKKYVSSQLHAFKLIKLQSSDTVQFSMCVLPKG